MKVVIFAVVIAAVFGLLALLPAIEIDVDAVTSSSAWTWILAACYFIPVPTVSAIGAIILALWTFRVVVALVRTIWDMLPVG